MWSNYDEMLTAEGQLSLEKTLVKESQAYKVGLSSPIGEFPVVSLTSDEQEELNSFSWPRDLDFKVKPDLAKSKIAFVLLVENLCANRLEEDDLKSEFLSKMEGVPCDPTKPRSTPFEDLDLNSLWGDPSKDKLNTSKSLKQRQVGVKHETNK